MTPKFRAWHKKEKKIYEIEQINFLEDEIYLVGNLTQFRSKDIILMQFTGLKDKRGKEIFEGDVVKMDAGGYFLEETIMYIRACKGIVFWEFVVNGEGGGCGDEIETEGEVIGNIHENPGLLREGKKVKALPNRRVEV